MYSRIEVILKKDLQDPRGLSLYDRIKKWNPRMAQKIQNVRVVELFWVQFKGTAEEFSQAAKDIWWDEVLHQSDWPKADWVVENEFHPGTTDNLGKTAHEALEICCQRGLPESRIASGHAYLFEGADLTREDIEKITESFISNPLIHRHRIFNGNSFANLLRFEPSEIASKFFLPAAAQVDITVAHVQTIAISKMNDQELVEFSKKNLLSLTLSEMKAIQRYFSSEKREPTDVEIEILAQTWSEHCKHKIFAADVEYSEDEGVQTPSDLAIPGENSKFVQNHHRWNNQ